MFQVFDQLVILSRSADFVKKLLLADLRDDRWCGRGWCHQQRDKEDSPESRRDH